VAAFVIGAFFAGVAGVLSATLSGNLDPGDFNFVKSIVIVVMVVLGGSGSITGSVLAAILLTYLPEQLRAFEDWRLVIYALLLIVMMLVRPEGLLGNRELGRNSRRRRRG
jgi:branched-chain amino acid transport system permease protein